MSWVPDLRRLGPAFPLSQNMGLGAPGPASSSGRWWHFEASLSGACGAWLAQQGVVGEGRHQLTPPAQAVASISSQAVLIWLSAHSRQEKGQSSLQREATAKMSRGMSVTAARDGGSSRGPLLGLAPSVLVLVLGEPMCFRVRAGISVGQRLRWPWGQDHSSGAAVV